MAQYPPVTAGWKQRLQRRLISGPGALDRLRARRFGVDYFTRRPPQLELYYEPGDPHSHLCAQLLSSLRQRLRVPLVIHVLVQEEGGDYPEMQRQRQFAVEDARRIAPAWGLSIPEAPEAPKAIAPPAQAERREAARILLAAAGLDDFIRLEAELAKTLFDGGNIDGSAGLDSATADRRLQQNARRRTRLGHYLPAMWQFNGDWFWGVDRLDYLQRALREAGVLEGEAPLCQFDAAAASLPEVDSAAPLEFFYSFRSPYSYLAAVALRERLAALPVDLQVRPVLPMAMRGFKVPLAKRLYISRDVYREAQKLDIPFGLIADPLGDGASRCLTVYPLAEGAAGQLDFLVSAATACWSEGVDLATDEGLRFAAERAGMPWQAVKTKLEQGPDLDYAEANREQLFAAGFWGVPSFRLGSFSTWGRDRWWMVEEILRRRVISDDA